MKRRTVRRICSVGLALLLVGGIVWALRFGIKKYYDVRYPLKYTQQIETCAEIYDLPTSFVYAVAHTESRFDPQAVSQVDARGIMQITRDTFDWIQHKMGLQEPLPYDEYCFDPDISIRYGAYLLKLLFEEFDSYETALCAYHAGRGNVLKWLQDPQFSADGTHIDHIPFKDTAWYVSRVMETQKIYQQLYDLE